MKLSNIPEVKIICDSISESGSRLTTFQLKYQRFIHAEFMTHRAFSRNASSSRAIPVKKMLNMVRTEPASPIHWGQNQAGMQAEHELSEETKAKVQALWLKAAQNAADIAEEMEALNAHKQVVNRILEPFQWINVVMTTSYIQNYWDLRCHPDAQPEIKVLAEMMHNQYQEAVPQILKYDEFHLPYIHEEEKTKYPLEDLIKFSVSRCARVSYLNHDQSQPNQEKDLNLYDGLVGSDPLHASPTEHQARPSEGSEYVCDKGNIDAYHGNFSPDWLQYRKFIEKKEESFFSYINYKQSILSKE